METNINTYIQAFQQLFFPHHCLGCGADYIQRQNLLCAACLYSLPETHFFLHQNNPVEQVFTGRIPVIAAGAGYYFYKAGLVQHLIAHLKYKQHLEVGRFLGRCLGAQLKASGRFNHIDYIMPLPLHPKKEFERGYNQAKLVCEGIIAVWPHTLCSNAITRLVYTSSQTQGNRLNRWKNMESAFWPSDPNMLKNKNILLVDDVVTTGASLEACARAILQVPGTSVSIATVAYTV